MSRTTKHTGAIKSLQFNPLKPQILATAGTKGELYIYDVNDISNPFRLGTAAARSDDLECVAWNRKVAHILATGGSGGFVTVWDLKTKKASLTLNNNRKAVGAIAWDPNNPTKLLTATPDDSSPAILLWDLRNSNAPERVLQGHDQGILSLSWCQQDSDLLLSCGKDNRTLCWNPQTGERLGEFPEVTNWTFQTRFNPHNPNLSATASFDGKIAIQTLQNTNPSASQTTSQGPADGEDFFTKAQTQPQGASFTLLKAPKWLECPVGASFGFGGKLVSFHLQHSATGQTRFSKVQISQFSVDSDVGTATESFEKALKAGDIDSICENHIAQAKTEEEKADWKVIQTLIADNPRKRVTEYLGFSEANQALNGIDESEGGVGNGQKEDVEKNTEKSREDGKAPAQSRLSTFFADGAEHDDFLSNLAATKGAKTDNPFEIYSASDSPSDRQITKALLLGQFEKAMMICLKDDRMADAFMIANCGGKDLVERAQAAYLSRKSQGPNYLRLLASVIGKNLWDIVYNADLDNWKESMATLCTYADPNEFPDLCEALGDRIFESGSRKDASFCYLVGSKLEKVIGIWISELQENEQASMKEPSGDSTFSVHARSLQNFIEKVTVFRKVTKFQDKERDVSAGWKLAPLYDRYIEYADIVAAHGHLSTAETYLDLLPAQYPAAEVARSRVKLASRTAAPQANVRQQQSSMTRSAPRAQPIVGYQPQQAPAASQTPTSASAYAPPASAIGSNPYAPSNINPYAPQQSYLPPQQQQGFGAAAIPSPMGYTQGGPQNSFGAPPRNTAPSVPPPSRAKDMANWNDTPMVTKPAISRRGTPSINPAPITSPFPNQQNLVIPPSAPPFGAARGSPTPPPPPPKGPAPPRMTSPLSASGPNPTQSMRASSTSNTYAPPPPQPGQQYGQGPPPPTIARGPSPYNPPPTGAVPPSRYAPAPAAQQYSQPSMPQSQIPPPPQSGNRPPPSSSPYAPQQTPQPSQGPYSPAQSPYQPQQGASQQFQGQSQGQPMSAQQPQQSQQTTGSRPGTGQSQPPKSALPAAPKYPSGDRSHIPPNAQQMVSIFNTDMQRVASRAPPAFAAQVKDTQKRLNILFDHLNNEDLLKPDTIERLNALAQALQSKDYDTASRMQVDIQRDKLDECGNWMVNLSRIFLSRKDADINI
jgi:protein transport protein SEC31